MLPNTQALCAAFAPDMKGTACWQKINTFALLACVLLATTAILVQRVDGLSQKRTAYFDEDCNNPTGSTTLTFGGFGNDDDGNPTLGKQTSAAG